MSNGTHLRGSGLAAVALALSLGRSALAGGQTLTFTTPSLAPAPGGYIECVVTATSVRPIGIVAAILDADGTNVTDFGTGFRASPATTGNGQYAAEETAASFSEGYCTATVTGARKKDVTVSLTAHAAP